MHRVKIIKEIFMDEHTITINNLCTSIDADIGIVKAVENVSFSIKKGEVFGLVGESGCGKTMTALSIMGLVPPPGRIVSGEIIFEGKDITRLNEKEMQDIRGNKIGMIFQSFNLITRTTVIKNVLTAFVPDLPWWQFEDACDYCDHVREANRHG